MRSLSSVATAPVVAHSITTEHESASDATPSLRRVVSGEWDSTIQSNKPGLLCVLVLSISLLWVHKRREVEIKPWKRQNEYEYT